jgi:hypothetical protein
MKFICLICADTLMEDMSEAEAAQHYRDYEAFTAEICRSGHYIGCNRLLPPETAKTLRVRNGKVSTVDGPFAETKEHLGGYFVIEAENMDEALRIAAGIPGGWHGCVEVRPIAEDAPTLKLLAVAAGKQRA